MRTSSAIVEENDSEATIVRSMPILEAESLDRSDRICLESISAISHLRLQHHNGVASSNYTTMSFCGVDVIAAQNGTKLGCDTVWLPLPNFPMSSKPFRYGVLTLASAQFHKDNEAESLAYLNKFYRYTREAFHDDSVTELVPASYMAILHCSLHLTRESFDIMLTHLIGLARAALHLNRTGKSNTYQSQFNELYKAAFHLLQHLYIALARQPPLFQQDFAIMAKVHETFQTFKDLHRPPFLMPTEPSLKYTCLTQFRKRALVFYLDYYLALRKQTTGPEREMFQSVSSLLTQLLVDIKTERNFQEDFRLRLSESQTPFEDMKAALLATFALFLESLLYLPLPGPYFPIMQTAYRLFHLCQIASLLPWTTHESHPLTRYLFWVGLILRKDIDALGKPFVVIVLIAV